MIIRKIGSFQISSSKKRKRLNTCYFSSPLPFNTNPPTQSAPIYETPKISFLTAHSEEEKISYGNALLKDLHNFYYDLILGQITYNSLESLRKTLDLERGRDSSKELEDIINLIETRVQVELTKGEKALSSK